ncbi:MAG: type II toxin-antitoxin system VapC family toxin [Opitutales bacterium]|nr:type II toxin-antitoxin system VapC family toxin [Opitutales bacterium]
MTKPFPDTSFLCAIYREQVNSGRADRIRARIPGALPVSALVLFEFRQSVRLHVRLRRKDRNLGFSKAEGAAMLRDLQSDLATGVLDVVPVDWAGVFALAEMLSAKHTETGGHRFADILHVATALHLGAAEFLTFDDNQQALAGAEGMAVPDDCAVG